MASNIVYEAVNARGCLLATAVLFVGPALYLIASHQECLSRTQKSAILYVLLRNV